VTTIAIGEAFNADDTSEIATYKEDEGHEATFGLYHKGIGALAETTTCNMVVLVRRPCQRLKRRARH
jgi:hypothetical protein